MTWTEQDEARLSELESRYLPQASAPTPEDRPGLISRTGQRLANLPFAIGQSLPNAAITAANMLGGDQPRMDYRPFSPPPAETFGEKAVDLGSGIAEVVGQSALPMGLVSRGARLLGAGPTAARIIGDVAGGAVVGAQNSAADAAVTGGEFGAMGAISALLPGGGVRRALTRAALNAAIPPAGAALRGEDPFTGQVGAQAAAQALLGSGAIGAARRLFKRAPTIEAPSIEPDYSNVPDAGVSLGIIPGEGRLRMREKFHDYYGPQERVQEASLSPEEEAIIGPSAGRSVFRRTAFPVASQAKSAQSEVIQGSRPWHTEVHDSLLSGHDLSGWTPDQLMAAHNDALPGTIDHSLIEAEMSKRISAETGSAGLPSSTAELSAAPAEAITPRTISEVASKGDTVSMGGVNGKLILRDDGTYFRRNLGGEKSEVRVYGALPDAPVTEIPDIEHVKIGPKKVQESRAFLRRIDAPRVGQLSGEVSPEMMSALSRAGMAVAGGLGGYAQDPDETGVPRSVMALAGAASGAALPGAARKLFQIARNPRAAIEAEQRMGIMPGALKRVLPGTETALEDAARKQHADPTLTGQAVRFMEKNVLGKSPDVANAMEIGRGYGELHGDITGTAAKVLRKALPNPTPVQLADYADFQSKPLTGSSEAKLRASLGDKAADAMLEMRKSKADMQTAIAAHDPTKQSLIDKTLGTYVTSPYEAFLNPNKWIKAVRKDPASKEAVVKLFATKPHFQGMDEWDVRSAVDEYTANVLKSSKGQDATNASKSSKVSQYLWTHRKYLDPEVKTFLGEVRNPIEREILTNMKLVQSASKAKAMRELTYLKDADGHPMIMSRDDLRAARASSTGDTLRKLEGYREIPDSPGFGSLGGMMAPREIHDAINAHGDVLKAGGAGWMGAVNNLIKNSMTTLNLPTHMHNWLQVAQQGIVAGVYNPMRYIEAAKLIAEKRDGYRKMIRTGMVGSDFASSELRGNIHNLTDMLSGKQTVGGAYRKVKAGINTAYGMPDWLVRTASYLQNEPQFIAEGKARGLTGPDLERFAEAETIKHVNRYTINYHQASPLVRMGRNLPGVSPFLTYTAGITKVMKNLAEDALTGTPKQRAMAVFNLTHLIGAPLGAAAAAYGHLSKQDQAEWDKIQAASPDYAKGQIRIPLGKDKSGNWSYLNAGPITSAGDIAVLLRNLVNGDLSAIASTNPVLGLQKSPALNLVAGLVGEKDPFSQQPVKTNVERAKFIARSIVPPMTPGLGSEWDRAGRAFTRTKSGELGVTDSRTGRRDTPADIARTQLGLRTSTVNLRQLQLSKRMNQQEELSQAKAEMNKVLRTDASGTDIEKAHRKFLKRRQEILNP